MNRSTSSSAAMQSASRTARANLKLLLFLAAAVLATIVPAIAQMGGGLQDKIAILKESLRENQLRLHQYQWMETTQLTLKGDPKPPKSSLCQYGPDGTVQKEPIGPPPPPPSGGRLKQRIIEKKKEEMQEYMGQVKNLLSMYVPPNPLKMEQAFQAGNVSLNPNPGAQETAIVFRNYAQPGDQMTVSFNTAVKKVTTVQVNTYMDDPKDTVTLMIQMASLPDGTNYVQQSILNATAKQLQVTTTNSNYQRLGGQ